MRLRGVLVRQKRGTECLKQGPVHRVATRIVFRVPLNAERKTRRVGDPNRFDRAVFGHALDDDALSGLENALTVQGVHADGLPAEKPCEGTAGNQADIMSIGEDNSGIGMYFTVRQSRHPMVHSPRQLADLRM